jgi:N-carbamoylputrescine amidase
MKATVCEFSNDPDRLKKDWDGLVAHVRAEKSGFVLLPEMPFHPWLARSPKADPAKWAEAVRAHERWLERLEELAPAAVAGAIPVIRDGKHLNEGFVWEKGSGLRTVHAKYYLPNEAGFWEANWYERGEKSFEMAEIAGAKAGFLICSEQWFTEHARSYGKRGAHLILCPRATPVETADKWVAGGRVVSVTSGAYCLSSNRGGVDAGGMKWGGTGWISEPEEGAVMALTSQEKPFVTMELDLAVAERAKSTYPRNVRE